MSSDSPNILIIMADQMTAALTGAYGHPVVQTPALDRLCAQGVRFDAAYTNCPLCTPARAAMLSGRFASRTRTYDNASIFPADTPTFAHILRSSGYEVVASGKMHLIGADQLHGFERRLTTDIYPASFAWTPSWEEYELSGIQNEKGAFAAEASECDWNMQLAYDTETQSRALEFLKSRHSTRDKDCMRPFCLLVSYTHPHPPYQITRKYWDMYENDDVEMPTLLEEHRACATQMDRWLHDYEGVSEEAMSNKEAMRNLYRAYFGMVSYVDSLVAELVEMIETFGLRKNTVILFLSDHGDMLCERGLIEKRCFYERSSRIPLIASFPERLEQGSSRSELVSLIDIFPTLADLAGLPHPIDADGSSFLDLLEGREGEGLERIVISEYHGEGVAGCCYMARKGQFKYTYVHEHGSQLFDLAVDPLESHNLVDHPDYMDIQNELHEELIRRFDFDRVAADVLRSQTERLLIKDAMAKGEKQSWDYQPHFDAKSSYVR
jgi:choline-sulfatase